MGALRDEQFTFQNRGHCTEGTPCKRLNSVAYADDRFLAPEIIWLKSKLYTKALQSLYVEPINHHEWMARLMIAKEDETRYWLKKADEECLGEAEEDYEEEEAGPKLLERASKICIKTLKAETETLKKTAKAKLVPTGDTKVKAPWTSRTPHEFSKLERSCYEYYEHLFAYRDATTGVVILPSAAMIQRSLELVDKKNEKYEDLLKALDYLDCGTRVVKRKPKKGKSAKGETSKKRKRGSDEAEEEEEEREEGPTAAREIDGMDEMEEEVEEAKEDE